MGKSKKSKKTSINDDADSDIEVPTTENVQEPQQNKAKPKKGDASSDEEASKKHPKKKKSVTEEVSKVTKNLKNLKVSSKKKSHSSEEDSDEEAIIVKAKAKPIKKSGFALLEVDDLDSPPSEPEPLSEPEEEKTQKLKPQKNDQSHKQKEQDGKKGKKAKRKKNMDDDDELDRVLAELEMEYSGVKIEKHNETQNPGTAKSVHTDTQKAKKESKVEDKPEDVTNADNEDESEKSTVKTGVQSRKEKKEREKLKKQAVKSQETEKTTETPSSENNTEKKCSESAAKTTTEKPDGDVVNVDSKKKKKGEKVEKVEKEEKTKKGPAKKAIAAMQEALKKIKEEEERLKKEEEERIKREVELENLRLEAIRLEQEKKEIKRKKEKERKERLKAEGKLLTPKQKADKARAMAMLESLKSQGLMPDIIERKTTPSARVRPNKLKSQTSQEQATSEKTDKKTEAVIVETKVEPEQTPTKPEQKKEDLIKDSWDAASSSSEDENEQPAKQAVEEKDVKGARDNKATKASKDNKATKDNKSKSPKEDPKSTKDTKDKQENHSDSSDSSSEEDSDEDSESESEDDQLTDAQRRRKRALTRIMKRRAENEAAEGDGHLRAAVVCVLGHVDTGKTKILDKLRRTNVQDGEAGGITQQIGATNVPIENIKEQTRHVKSINEVEFRLPGLLIIDTPGHESFSNLRSRGSSLCDIAILVVDIMHGLEPQTLESIDLLKKKKTPFLVALNKIDRLYDWQSAQRKDIRDILKMQHHNTQMEFDKRSKEVILQFAEQGLNAALFYENPDPRTYVSLVPTSAVTGEGMGNLLAMIVQACEGPLHKRLIFSQQLQATVLEVKAIPGLGTTIDAILINGTLHEGDTVCLAGTDGPIVTQIRSLLMPQPMKELRVKNAYIEYKEVVGAQGVKIAAKELEKAIAGLNLLVAHKPDEVEILREEVAKELKSALSSIKLSDRGVYVQASTLGSLEALLEFLRTSKIPYSAIRIGPVVKRDVMKASAMLEHDSQFATILAFDVRIERDAQELADHLGVKIFAADIIYHLFDAFTAHRDELKRRNREEFKSIAVFPCKLRVLPQFVFNSRDPIVCGVMIEAGIVKEGTPICVPTKEFVEIGIVTSIESNHKQVETARKGQEVCIKIEPLPGDAPKMFGRHFDETDFLVSKITRQSIDACKDHFRDDLIKTDWQLMVELKKQFEIL